MSDPSGAGHRLELDLAARRAVFKTGSTITVAAEGAAFWRRYAAFIQADDDVEVRVVDDAPPYPDPDKGVALWHSGGVESTYTRLLLEEQGVQFDMLAIEDYPLFTGADRAVGQIHFLCAAIAAAAGYGSVYLGMERNDLLLGPSHFMRGYVERHPVFAQWWTEYLPQHPAVTLCGNLHKEQIILALHERGVPVTGTCDTLRGGAWCGDCYKCFEHYYSAKAVELEPGFRLRRDAFERYHEEYRRFVDSSFTDNYNNAYQHYVRLQVTYGVSFNIRDDCLEERA